jgi:hypothetical protein
MFTFLFTYNMIQNCLLFTFFVKFSDSVLVSIARNYEIYRKFTTPRKLLATGGWVVRLAQNMPLKPSAVLLLKGRCPMLWGLCNL